MALAFPGTRERSSTAASGASAQGERELLSCSPLAPEAALAKLSSSDKGLSSEQARERAERYGPNSVEREHKAGPVRDLLGRCRNPLVIQLLIIAFVSLGMGDQASAAVVGVMVVLSVALSYFQERRSSKAVERLLAMVKTTCTVLRDGRETEAPMSELVPGDVVVLAAGSIIPADLRLISAKDFFVSQAALTGESMPVEKTAAACDAAGKNALDLGNAAFLGSNVLSGTARGLVVNTGPRTYFGSISHKLASRRTLTSFDRGIADFTWLMVKFMVVMVAAVFLIVGLTKGNWIEARS